jgi:hypothetical protein
VQEVRAATAGPRSDPTAPVSLRALLLAGAFPLIPPEKVPPSVRPGLLYGEFTPMTLRQGAGEGAQGALQLGTAAVRAAVGRLLPGRDSSSGEAGNGVVLENGTAADGASRPGSAAPAVPSPGAAGANPASAAAKPRRQPPPPPPKI